MSNWVLNKIDPTVFNVVSDAIAQVVAAILISALGAGYPCLLWYAIKRGHGIPLDSVLAPPETFFQAIKRFKARSAWVLMLCIAFALLVASFAHTAADIFLKFETVQVASENIQVLGSQTVNALPCYSLLGDKSIIAETKPDTPQVRLQFRGDYITRGLSRFSVFSRRPDYTEHTDTSPFQLVLDTDVSEAQPVSGTLGVQCHSSDSVLEFAGSKHVKNKNGTLLIDDVERVIPDCDFERDISGDLVHTSSHRPDGWKVVGRTGFVHFPPEGEDYVIGFLDGNGYFANSTHFTAEETMLPIFREDWSLGRKVQDGLTLAVRGSKVFPFQVEHSVLSWPNTKMDFAVDFMGKIALMTGYTLSSWSRNCPTLVDTNRGKSFTIQDYSQSTHGPSGCVIDTFLVCHIFPEDDLVNATDPMVALVFGRECWAQWFDVTLVDGMSVSPIMLALYSSMYFRGFYDETADIVLSSISKVPVNALAAAYILTRQVESGSLALSGVRPSISVGYLILMILPIVVALPLLYMYCNNPSPPIPNSLWKAMVFGRSAEVALPFWGGIQNPFPPEEPVEFGIVKGRDYNQPDSLGLIHTSQPQPQPQPPVTGAKDHPDPMQFSPEGVSVACPMPPEQTKNPMTVVRQDRRTYRTNPDGTRTQVITTKRQFVAPLQASTSPPIVASNTGPIAAF